MKFISSVRLCLILAIETIRLIHFFAKKLFGED